MNSVFRTTRMPVLLFAAALAVAGCAKHPTVAAPASPAALEEAVPGDRKIIVAKVNGADINKYALINMMDRLIAINIKSSISEPREAVRKKALDQLIFQELAYQEAMRLGLHVEELNVDKAMEKFITSMGHEEGYNDFLTRQQLTPVEVRASIERSLLLQLIASREVLEKVSVTDDDVLKEYEQQKDQHTTPEKVTVVDVMISPKLDGQASMKKANEILAAINAEKDKNPRNLVPDDNFTMKSRDLQKEKETALYDAARTLKQGELSGAIKTGDGVHILQLTQYEPAKRTPFEEVKGPLKETLKAMAQIKRFQEWEQELKKDAKVELLEAPEQQVKKKP
jgi:parvulin-like peptidyl-prolyl isomerase